MFLKKQKQNKQGPWSQRKLSITNPFPRYGHSINQSSVNDELLFIFGGIVNGRATNEIFMVEINTLNVCRLNTTGDSPSPRSLHTQVNIGNKMIVFSGLLVNPEEKLDNNLYILNIATQKWYKPPIQGDPIIGRFDHSATAIETKMYIYGGRSDGYFLNDLVALDLQTLSSGVVQWEFIVPSSDPPPGRAGQTICAYDNRIYAFGGTDGERCHNDTWCYDIRTKTWSELPCIGYIPAPRKNHGVAIIDDIMYIFGGKGQDGTELGDLVALRISNLRWYMFADMGVPPIPRQAHAMTSIREKILVFGGDCPQYPKPGEDGMISVLDTSKIKYPPLQKQQSQPQTRSTSSLESNRSPSSLSSNNNIITTRQNPVNQTYDNRVKNSTHFKQISPSGSQGSLTSPSPSPSPKMMPDNSGNMNILSSRTGPQGSPRNQYYPKRPQNVPTSRSSSIEQSRYHNNTEGVSDSSQSFENPRQAPRPPNSPNGSLSRATSPLSHNLSSNSMPKDIGIALPSPASGMSQSSSTSHTFDALDHFPTPISNTERDKFLRELQNRDVQITQFKTRENWLKAELSLARQAGYTPEEDKVPDGIDAENFMDIGEPDSNRRKIMIAVVKIKQELRRAKATIANQAQVASQKITDAERARTAALQEAAYFKAKSTALLNASDSELSKIENDRTADLEKRLTQALLEKESLQSKIHQFQQTSGYDKNSRKAAEELARSATTRAEEAEEAHARALAELATLHSRTTTAESQLRENNTRLAETTADLLRYRSGSDNSRNQIDQLQQSLEQHQRALEKVNQALLAANERTGEAESLWRQARQDIVSLEKDAAGLRAELDIKMRDLDRTHARSNEMERLLIKAQKEVDAVRSMMQDGMAELLNSSRANSEGINNSSEAAKRIIMLEKEIENLKSANNNSEKFVQETSSSLEDAMVKISQMESAAMKARSDSAILQRKLVEASDENARMKDKLRERERLLTERTKALEDAEIKVGMMKGIITEKEKLSDGDSGNKESDRFKELELKYEELENMHNQAIKKAKDAEEKVKTLEIELEHASSAGSIPDSSKYIEETKTKGEQKELEMVKQKLHQVENDYQTAVHYVNSSEKMLRKMKEELTKNKKEVGILNDKLLIAEKRNEELEGKLSEAENGMIIRKELRESKLQELTNQKLEEQRSEFINERGKLQEDINDLQSQLERAYDEKNMTDAEYEVLRKEYESLRKENESLQLIDQELRDSLKDSEKALRNTQNELDEIYSNVSKEFKNSMKPGPKGTQDRKSWEEPRAILERQVSEYRAINEKLVKENSELEQKYRESENKIALLLDQMEHAVDSYREIEVDIRDSSPRNSNIISSLTNELDALRSQWDASNQDSELSDDDESWNRSQNDNENDDNGRMIFALAQKTATQRKLSNIGNMFDDDDDNNDNFSNPSPTDFNNSTKRGQTRMIDQIRGQLSLTPPPTPPASSH